MSHGLAVRSEELEQIAPVLPFPGFPRGIQRGLIEVRIGCMVAGALESGPGFCHIAVDVVTLPEFIQSEFSTQNADTVVTADM